MVSSSFLSFTAACLVSSAAAANFQVQVGPNSTLVFDPVTINAAAGDTVTYNFHPKNHSVTQSSFMDPCHPLTNGFFSGFVPTADPNAASATQFTITVNDTKPIWVYCAQTTGEHCQSGMVHAINAPTTGNTIDAYKSKAKIASASTSPFDGLPIGGQRKTTIQVGPDSKLVFSPSNITALPGEVIEFDYNPKNHSVTQSSFAKPCVELEGGGFSSGFVPAALSPSGSNFQITVNDTKPIWFYCAQTTGSHCQKGMVGSINAPLSGSNTFDAFVGIASQTQNSTIGAFAPVGGILTFNGTVVATGQNPTNGDTSSAGGSGSGNSSTSNAMNGNPSASSNSSVVSSVPPPGTSIPADVAAMAGGYQPSAYNWAPTISDVAVNLLGLIEYLDNTLLEALVNGHNNLTSGGWTGVYPNSITDTLGSMMAQALVHRATATDSLTHYSKPLIGLCQYSFPINNVDDFVHVALTLTSLEIALFLDVISLVATSDPWLVSVLSATLGSKSRMAGMVNMMQSHMAAAAPREVMLPASFVYSYVVNHFIVQGSCPNPLPYPTFTTLSLTYTPVTGSDKVTSVSVTFEQDAKDLSLAWIGPYGIMEYSPIPTADATQRSVSVPADLSGHVWVVLVNSTSAKTVDDLVAITIAGPEMIWITQP